MTEQCTASFGAVIVATCGGIVGGVILSLAAIGLFWRISKGSDKEGVSR